MVNNLKNALMPSENQQVLRLRLAYLMRRFLFLALGMGLLLPTAANADRSYSHTPATRQLMRDSYMTKDFTFGDLYGRLTTICIFYQIDMDPDNPFVSLSEAASEKRARLLTNGVFQLFNDVYGKRGDKQLSKLEKEAAIRGVLAGSSNSRKGYKTCDYLFDYLETKSN